MNAMQDTRLLLEVGYLNHWHLTIKTGEMRYINDPRTAPFKGG
ncbi:hypothetical protein [Coleofasciculus sp. H7-2]